MALKLFTALHHFHTQNDGVLNNAMHSHVVDALAKSPNVEHVRRADGLLRQFIGLYLGRQSDVAERVGGFEAEALPTVPGAIQWNDDRHHVPNQIRITGVMRGYARQFHPKGAESLLNLMVSLSASGGNKGIFRPNEFGFGTVIDAYSRMDDGSNAERILRLMKQNGGANIVAYNSTISAWARTAKHASSLQSSREAAETAERLLREMWSEHEAMAERRALLPDVVTYSSVISAYASCRDQPYGVGRARELLTELEGLAAREANESRAYTTTSRKGGGRHPHGFQSNEKVYNTITQAYANVGDAAGAEAILQKMISLHSSSTEGGGGGTHQHVRPDTRTFNIVLNAWSKSGGSDAGVRAREILARLEDLATSGDYATRPDIVSYNTVLSAWSNGAKIDPASVSEEKEEGNGSAIVGISAAHEALELLDRIERQYIARSKGGSFDRREPFLVKPDAISYNTTIAAFANAAQHDQDGTRSAEQAESILSRMLDRLGITPDDYSFNGVLLAWARSSGGLPAAKRAESILRSMKAPTLISWSLVITAYAHADDAPKAEVLLREMERDAKGKRRSSPNVVLYNSVLHAWSRSSEVDASRQAESLLARMEESSELPSPTANSYRMVLNALEHSNDHDKAKRGKAVLDRLLASVQAQKVVATPRDIQSAYNSVLTACAYTPGSAEEHHRNDAVQVIMETFRDMNGAGAGGPNQESYALFMQGCSHLFNVQEERDVLLKAAFRECCQRGLLNNIIWDKLCTALGPESTSAFVDEMMPSNESDGGSEKEDGSCLWAFEELPEEWSGRDPS
ncbi:hypothetical protein ACHAXT_003646 [Thalassiosira profunda]